MLLQDVIIQPVTRSDHVEYALLYLSEQSPEPHQPTKFLFLSPWTAQILIEQINAELKEQTLDVLALSRAKLRSQQSVVKEPIDAMAVSDIQNAKAVLRIELKWEKAYRTAAWAVKVFVCENLSAGPYAETLTGTMQDLYNFSADLSEAFRSND